VCETGGRGRRPSPRLRRLANAPPWERRRDDSPRLGGMSSGHARARRALSPLPRERACPGLDPGWRAQRDGEGRRPEPALRACSPSPPCFAWSPSPFGRGDARHAVIARRAKPDDAIQKSWIAPPPSSRACRGTLLAMTNPVSSPMGEVSAGGRRKGAMTYSVGTRVRPLSTMLRMVPLSRWERRRPARRHREEGFARRRDPEDLDCFAALAFATRAVPSPSGEGGSRVSANRERGVSGLPLSRLAPLATLSRGRGWAPRCRCALRHSSLAAKFGRA
jgi:hypothetical protein